MQMKLIFYFMVSFKDNRFLQPVMSLGAGSRLETTGPGNHNKRDMAGQRWEGTKECMSVDYIVMALIYVQKITKLRLGRKHGRETRLYSHFRSDNGTC